MWKHLNSLIQFTYLPPFVLVLPYILIPWDTDMSWGEFECSFLDLFLNSFPVWNFGVQFQAILAVLNSDLFHLSPIRLPCTLWALFYTSQFEKSPQKKTIAWTESSLYTIYAPLLSGTERILHVLVSGQCLQTVDLCMSSSFCGCFWQKG